jgi:hypothetical protein
MSYLTATLTKAEVTVISDPIKLHQDATLELKKLSESLHANEDEFEISLRIRNTLCEYEEKAKTEPSMEVLAVLLNGEFRLWQITEGLHIETNPFLTHWIDALIRMEEPSDITNDNVRGIFRIRARCIKGLIMAADGIRGVSPYDLLQHSTKDDVDDVDNRPVSTFDLQRYMQILVNADVWDKSDLPKQPTSNGKKASHNQTPELWQHVLLRKLSEEPKIAVQDITHLPLQLEHLEFLTKLLIDGTLEAHWLEPSSVITPYIQHALRLMEKMEAPPPTSDQNLPTNGSVDGLEDGATIVEYGKEAQRRAVNLLLLFIKNLIVKDLLGTQSIYFEIEEICVRYVWIKEGG